MKSFLASLAARAHGVADVVQPRARALFEPEAPGGKDAVAEPHVEAAAPTRALVPSEVSRSEPRLSERIIEVEHLLAGAPPPASGRTVASPTEVAPSATIPLAPVVAEPVAVERPIEGAVMPPPILRPVEAPAAWPAIPLRRVEPAPAIPSRSATLAPSTPVPPPQAQPNVTIRIERIDVRAIPPGAPVSRSSAARRAPARPSLDDYLASRR